MRNFIITSFTVLLLCTGISPAQQVVPATSYTAPLQARIYQSDTNPVCVLLPARLQAEIITWNGNILHTISKTEKSKGKGLQKMISDAAHEAGNMQKTIAVADVKPATEKKSIFQYRKVADGLTEGRHSITIR